MRGFIRIHVCPKKGLNSTSDHRQAYSKTVHRARSSTNDHMEGRTGDQRPFKELWIHPFWFSFLYT